MALLASCDGSRTLASFHAGDQKLLQHWHQLGFMVLASAEQRPSSRHDTVVVSPHPDDAVLSLGGLLAHSRGRVVNVFTVETWTRRPYYAARPDLTRRLLLEEERIACRVLSARPEFLGFLDAEARPGWRDGFFTDDPLSTRSVQAEPELFAAVTDRLGAALADATEIYVPLAVGGHVDHVACREAVLALVGCGTLDVRRIAFYEDLPYSLFTAADVVARGLAPRLSALGVAGLRPEPVMLDQPVVDAKREALRTYRIQLHDGITRRVLRYGAAQAASLDHPAAERIWRDRRSTVEHGKER